MGVFHLQNGSNITWMFRAGTVSQVTAALDGAAELLYPDHTFLGWSTQESGGTLVEPAAAADGEYFAQWQSTATPTPTPTPTDPAAAPANSTHGQKLAATGTDDAPWVAAGLGLSLAGLALAVAARLRRRNLTR
jgi:LPXTG-motif cell wall-anchored protein